MTAMERVLGKTVAACLVVAVACVVPVSCGYGYRGQQHESSREAIFEFETNRTFDADIIEFYRQYEVTPMAPMGYYFCATYMFFLCIFAIGGNFLILLMFCRNAEARKKPMNILILNTAISDFGVGIIGYPPECYSFFNFHFMQPFSYCAWQGFIDFCLAMVDMTTIIIFSIYRYLIVCHDCGSTLTVGFTVKLMVLVWIWSIFITGLPLVGINDYKLEVFGTTCTIDWEPQDDAGIYYIIFLEIFCFIIPVGFMIYCYARVIMVTSENTAGTSDLQAGKAADLGTAGAANDIMAEAKVTNISFIMVTAYLACWSPFMFISWYCMNIGGDVPVYVKAMPHLGAKLSCGINPLIFFATNKVFRDHFLATFIKNYKISASIADEQSFTIDKSKEGVFLGEQKVTFKKAKTSMF